MERHDTHTHGLAPRIGLAYQNLYAYIWGVSHATPQLVYKISKVLSLSADETQKLLDAQAEDVKNTPGSSAVRCRVGREIERKLVDLGINQKELSFLLGPDFKVYDLLTGKVTPDDLMLKRLSYTLEMSGEEALKLRKARDKDLEEKK